MTECELCSLTKEELIELIAIPSYHDQCKAWYDYSHDIKKLSELDYQIILHLISGGWEPDCVDVRNICKELNLKCSCSTDSDYSNCGKYSDY
jgi:hypothetical protein